MSARRVYCRGNCGRWWYYDGTPSDPAKHRGGRPREWCDHCLPMHTRERKAENLLPWSIRSVKHAGCA